MVLVVGSEGRGLLRVVANACDMLVPIPMVSGNESLAAASPRRSPCAKSPGRARQR
jgi:tRNA G18 (ribose-2'-O)-methylase SpoU